VKISLTWIALSCLIVGICLTAGQRTASAQETCWRVFYVSSGGPGDIPDEIICLTSETEGYVRETSIFGSGAIGCNRVTVDHVRSAMNFIVDYSKCTNNSPSHSIFCPPSQGDRLKCVWTMLDGSMAPSDAYLEREK
jgi:hypothetical protein